MLLTTLPCMPWLLRAKATLAIAVVAKAIYVRDVIRTEPRLIQSIASSLILIRMQRKFGVGRRVLFCPFPDLFPILALVMLTVVYQPRFVETYKIWLALKVEMKEGGEGGTGLSVRSRSQFTTYHPPIAGS